MRNALSGRDDPSAQIHLDNGHAAPTGPACSSARDARPGPDAYTFWVLVEPCNDAALPFMAPLVEQTLQQMLHRRLSITATLTRALQEVHLRMISEPTPNRATQGPTVGMAIAAMRGAELYLALAGPTLAVRRDGDHLEYLSALSPRDMRQGALGGQREPSIKLHRKLLSPAETVLLAHSPLRRAMAPDVLLAGLRRAPEDLLADVYRGLRQERHFAALVIAADASAFDGSGGVRTRPAPPPAPAAVRTPPRNRRGADLRNDAPDLDRPDPIYEAPPSHSVTAPPTGNIYIPPAAPTRPRAQSTWPLPNFRPLGIKLRAPKRQSSRRSGPSISIPPGIALAALAGLLVVVFGVALWYSGASNTAGREARAAALFDEASSLRDSALIAPTRDGSRQKLVQAQSVLTEAADLMRDDQRISQLQEKLTGDLKKLDAAEPLPEPKPLIDLRLAPGNALQLRSLVNGGGALITLERSANRIFQVDPSSSELKPQSPTPFQEAKVRTPTSLRQLLWMPSGGLWNRNSLLAFDNAQTLWEYRGWPAQPAAAGAAAQTPAARPTPAADEWVKVPLRGALDLGGLEAALGFAGNLYVLDAAAGQVWRYVPTDGGFDTERQGVIIGGGDIRDGVDLAIDGDLYVLTKGGKVLKFSGGRSSPFPMDGLDKPLSNPTAIATNPNMKTVYVADTGNGRVVVFDKSGRMQRQVLLSDKLPPVAGIAVDEGRKVMYLLTDRQLIAAALPE
ncbi:MAG: hypothetical protein NTZ05_16075 [Chloroflexi bacterium]|nr:hypothetical protein [Chloroflexota bacterium]